MKKTMCTLLLFSAVISFAAEQETERLIISAQAPASSGPSIELSSIAQQSPGHASATQIQQRTTPRQKLCLTLLALVVMSPAIVAISGAVLKSRKDDSAITPAPYYAAFRLIMICQNIALGSTCKTILLDVYAPQTLNCVL